MPQQQHATSFRLLLVGSLLFEEDSEVVNSPEGVTRDAEHMLDLYHYTAAQLILNHLVSPTRVDPTEPDWMLA